MRTARTLKTLWWACGLLLAGRVAAAESKPATVEDIVRINNIQEARISPDGSQVVYVVAEPNIEESVYDADIFVVSSKGGPSRGLTKRAARDDTPRWSRDGQLIAFISDHSGSNQIWLVSPDGDGLHQLTRVEGGMAAPGFLRIFPPYPQAFAWSPDGKTIAYLVPDQEIVAQQEQRRREKDDTIVIGRDVKTTQVHLIDVESGESRQLTRGKFTVNHVSWSPDGKEIAFSAQPKPEEEGSDPARAISAPAADDVFVVSVEGGQVRTLIQRDGMDSTPKWSPDGTRIAFVSDGGKRKWSANNYLYTVAAAGGTPQSLTQNFDEVIAFYHWAADSSSVLILARQKLTRHLFAVETDSQTVRQVTSGNRVHGSFSFSRDTGQMAFLAQDAKTAWDVYVSGVEEFDPVKITKTNPQLQKLALVEPEVVRWKASDGMEIEGLLYKPLRFEEGEKYPLVTCVHGGPSIGTFTLSISPQLSEAGRFPMQADPCILAHVFAGEGYVTFLPNPRGGAGYGEKFRQAGGRGPGYGEFPSSSRKRGRGDFQDILSGIDSLIERGIADEDKLGIMGWSYGGYMSAWAISQTDRFAAASAGAGPTNAISYFGTSAHVPPPDRLAPWQAMQDYLNDSAIYYGDNLKTPTLLQFPERDEIVPLSQAQELHRALQLKGVPTELHVYPREGHMLREPKHQLDMLLRNVEWFDRWFSFEHSS